MIEDKRLGVSSLPPNGPDPPPSGPIAHRAGDASTGPAGSYARSAWLFRRLLALAYLAAFASLLVQVRGLVGHDGILPAAELMDSARAWADSHGLSATGRFFAMPTV